MTASVRPGGPVVEVADILRAHGAAYRTTHPVSAEQAAVKARKMGLVEVEVKVNGPGSGRESAITALQGAGLKVTSIEDVTPVPHNGCRPPKRRRV